MTDKELYTWDELYKRAEDCSCLSSELKAKDEARNQLSELILYEVGHNIENCECPEDEIDIFLRNREIPVLFDNRGNIDKRSFNFNKKGETEM